MKRMNKKPNFIGKHKNGFFRTGLVLTGLVVFLVLLGMVWSPYDPTARGSPSVMSWEQTIWEEMYSAGCFTAAG